MFAQVITGRAKDAGGIRKEMDRWKTELMPGAEGFLGSTAGVTEDGRFITIARFESEDAARRNSDRPEQGAWWNEISQHIDGEATFRDSTEVEMEMGGGSDEAGFVQVIAGRATDKEKLQSFSRESSDRMRELRPDVIGGVTVWFGDEFVDFIYFTSEAEAREGERRMEVASEADRRVYQQYQELTADAEYWDLREPWLVSP